MSIDTVTTVFPIQENAEAAIQQLTPVYQVLSQGETPEGYTVIWKDSEIHRSAMPPLAMSPQNLDMLIEVVEANHGYLVGQADSLMTMAGAIARPSRLALPLPDSVWNRYYAEHPEEPDHRQMAKAAALDGLTFHFTHARELGGVEHYLEAHLHDEPVGGLTWKPSGEINQITVKEGYRRRGIATALYQHAQTLGVAKPTEGRFTTEDGKAWRASLPS